MGLVADIVGAIVKAIWEPLLKWFTTYQQGRTAQQRDDLSASLEKQKELDDAGRRARDDVERLGLATDDWLRRSSPSPPERSVLPPATPRDD